MIDILSVKCQGFGDYKKRKNVFEYLMKRNCNISVVYILLRKLQSYKEWMWLWMSLLLIQFKVKRFMYSF